MADSRFARGIFGLWGCVLCIGKVELKLQRSFHAQKITNERKSEMEEKTIGAFLSALRKSKGLTQRELAEMLNVSDKAVSRWERDECAPDLTLIPILAEIYDVTCDEILKGQRITKTKEEAPSVYVKSEKQLDRLLRKSRVNYLIQCIISVGVAVLGLIVSMVANFAFSSALAGFFIGSGFIAVAVVLAAVFTIKTFYSVADMELPPEKQSPYRYFLIFATEITASLIITIFALTLPLASAIDSIYGSIYSLTFITVSGWIEHGTVTGLIALAVSLITLALTYLILWKTPDDKENKKIRLRKLQIGIVLFSFIAVSVTFMGFIVTSEVTHSWPRSEIDLFSGPDKFYSIEDFDKYIQSHKVEGKEYNAKFNRHIFDPSGQKVRYTYNLSDTDIHMVDYWYDDDNEIFLKIYVYTQEFAYSCYMLRDIILLAFLFAIVVEIVVAIIIYVKKSRKIKKS